MLKWLGYLVLESPKDYLTNVELCGEYKIIENGLIKKVPIDFPCYYKNVAPYVKTDFSVWEPTNKEELIKAWEDRLFTYRKNIEYVKALKELN